MQVSHIGSFPPFEVEIVLIREFWDLLDAGGRWYFGESHGEGSKDARAGDPNPSAEIRPP